jgi:hypothetical protein
MPTATIIDRPVANPQWAQLKTAITNSSGFKQWEGQVETVEEPKDVDRLVRKYLRETLETLAY